MKTKDRFSKKGKMFNYIKNLKYLGTFLSSNEVGFTKKVEVIFLIAMMSIYLISPIDLVPDFIPVFGYMEDALVVFSMLSYAGNIISKYKFLIKPESEKVKGRIKKERDIIDVEFTEVKDEKNDDENKDN